MGDLPLARGFALPGVGGRRTAAFLTGAVSVTALGSANGGYYPGSWGWGAIAFLWAAGIALGFATDVSRLGTVVAGAGVALLVWTIASGLWSSNLTATGLASQRQLLYAATVIGGLAVARRSTVDALLAGVWAGTVLICGYGLLTRLLPDHIGVIDPTSGYRLSGPIGYWNSFGLLAAMGAILALGLAARAEPVWLRALAAASFPMLLVAQYYTFSRGAWLSLAAAFVVWVIVDGARLQLLLSALTIGWVAAVAVLLARSYPPLTTQGSTLAAEAHAGHRMLAELVLLAVASAASVAVLAFAARRTIVPAPVRRAAAGAILLVVLAAVVAFTVRFGAPWTAAQHDWHSFATAPSSGGANLNGRLFSLSSSGRVTLWRVAWNQVQAHPWLGGGAGTWADYWVRNRPIPSTVHNVHNLYLESLSELGPVGLALVLIFLLAPFAAVRRARTSPLGPAAAAALVAFALHAVVDWDWQEAGVTVPALLCAVALVLAADGAPVRARFLAPVAIAAVAVLLAASIYASVARVELARISSDARAGNLKAAESAAHRATLLEPWTSEGWVRLGDAAVEGNDLALARTAYRRALRRNPSDWQTWSSLAQVSSGAAGRHAAARAHALNPFGSD